MAELPEQTPTVVPLPPGVKVGIPRQTSQLNELGEVTEGAVYPVTLANGARFTVFIPYAQLGNAQYVNGVIAERAKALLGPIT